MANLIRLAICGVGATLAVTHLPHYIVANPALGIPVALLIAAVVAPAMWFIEGMVFGSWGG